MTNPLRSQSRPLLAGLQAAGVELGDIVHAAMQTQREAGTLLAKYEAEWNNANGALFAATASDFKKKADTLVRATAALRAAQEVNGTVQDGAEFALNNALTGHVDDYEGQLIEAFNGAVAEQHLNELAPSLPEFGADGWTLNALDLTEAQSTAILSWRKASAALHPFWNAYVSLAKYRGQDLGPVGLDGVWVNRLTATVLGANTAAQTMNAVSVFSAAAAGVESAKSIRTLLPFVASSIAGFALQLRPLKQAESLLRGMNAVSAPGSMAVGVG